MNATFPRFLGAVAVVVVVLTASSEASAPAGRYTTAGGTVFDTKTKLTWQQTEASRISRYTWAEAQAYCQQTVGASLGGTGWRLPTIKELQSIVDDSRWNPAIDPIAFPATPNAVGFVGTIWSSSPVAGTPAFAWYVDFSLYGIAGRADKVLSSNDVRCVR